MKARLLAALAAPLACAAAADAPAPPDPATRQIRVLETVMPALPRTGDAADGGCVTVRFRIKYDGFVGDVTVLEARPASLAEPTVAAVRQWHFQSFPPPDVYAVHTFNFTPDLVRLPDNAIRASLADLSGNEVRAVGCGGTPAAADPAGNGARR